MTIALNLNCRVDIILDSAKRNLHSEIETLLAKTNKMLVNPELLRDEAPPVPEGEDAPDLVAQKTAIKERLEALQKSLHNLIGIETLELQDESDAAIGVQTLLSQNGVEALQPTMKYTFGILSGEENSFQAF